jgi:hypothetical protein
MMAGVLEAKKLKGESSKQMKTSNQAARRRHLGSARPFTMPPVCIISFTDLGWELHPQRNFWDSVPKSTVVGFRIAHSNRQNVGLSATNPDKVWSRLNSIYKMQGGAG